MKFIIEGEIKPYVRMTQRGKFCKPEAIAYLESQQAIKLMVRNQMALEGWEKLPDKTVLKVGIQALTKKGHKCDLDNIVKAILDALQPDVFQNDAWVDEIHAFRCHVLHEESACVIVQVEALGVVEGVTK